LLTFYEIFKHHFGKKSTRLVGRAGLEKISPLCFEPKQKSPGPVVAEETELEIQNQIALHLFFFGKMQVIRTECRSSLSYLHPS
jgi:hypothetical protein